MDQVVVSRRPAEVQFIGRELGYEVMTREDVADVVRRRVLRRIHAPTHLWPQENEGTVVHSPNVTSYLARTDQEDHHLHLIPVLAAATVDDVRNGRAYGDIPLHLAARAAWVTVVEYKGETPTDESYDLAAMDAAGAVLRSYNIRGAAAARMEQAKARVADRIGHELLRDASGSAEVVIEVQTTRVMVQCPENKEWSQTASRIGKRVDYLLSERNPPWEFPLSAERLVREILLRIYTPLGFDVP